jgi:hypothetical protein
MTGNDARTEEDRDETTMKEVESKRERDGERVGEVTTREQNP